MAARARSDEEEFVVDIRVPRRAGGVSDRARGRLEFHSGALELPRLIESPERDSVKPQPLEGMKRASARRRLFAASGSGAQSPRKMSLTQVRQSDEWSLDELASELEAAAGRREAAREQVQQRVRAHHERVARRAAQCRAERERSWHRRWRHKEEAIRLAAERRQVLREVCAKRRERARSALRRASAAQRPAAMAEASSANCPTSRPSAMPPTGKVVSCCCHQLCEAGFPFGAAEALVEAPRNFEEATETRLQAPENIQRAARLVAALERPVLPGSDTAAQTSAGRKVPLSSGRVLLAAFLMQRYPEQVLDGWQSGDRDDRQVHTVASALCDALLEVVRADCGELMALRQRVSCLQRAWQQWRTTFASWKARDQERLVAGMIEDAVATEQLLVSMLPAGRVDASAVAAAEAVAAEWTPEIDRQLDRIRRAVRRVGGAAAVARMQQACGAVHQSVSETIDESAENAALDAWTSDADVVLAHEMMVDVSGLLARRRRDAPSAASSGDLWQHVASLMKQCYFERIQEALEREQYDPVVLEAMRDVKLALLQLLPVHAEPVEEVAGDAQRDALRSYRQQCGQLRRAVQREVDIAHVRQRLSAAMAPQGGQVAESAARRRVAFEELTRLVFWALQVLLLVQMPDKDEALLREWTVGEAGGRLCETAVRTRLRQRLLPMMTTAVDAPDTVPVDAAAVCAVFRELLALCEDRQADVAVARVRRYAPLVQQFGPEWERARFLASGASLQRTEAWLMPFRGEDGDVQAPEVDLSRAVRSGLVHGILLAVGDFAEPDVLSLSQCPEVLALDRQRLQQMRGQLQRALRCASVECVATAQGVCESGAAWAVSTEPLAMQLYRQEGAEGSWISAVAAHAEAHGHSTAAAMQLAERCVHMALHTRAIYTVLQRRAAEWLSREETTTTTTSPFPNGLFGIGRLLTGWRERVLALTQHLVRAYGPLLQRLQTPADGDISM
ncbi:hypothetical protein CDCA_CDCA12G3372 [Cyanidium caldarium]|uniref:Uncharacterized protein n=1 Tax=Cyanidium caldarium TaxID=2771 RepID=A0AAV9IYF6_CYACA|nr:hypothetical protein CDCA_CDCA12G3372 [Cyanidium caldarium]